MLRTQQTVAVGVYPEVFEVLQALRAQGLIMGVLSNWDIRLGPLLERLGLMPYLDHVILSAVVGWEKPHRRIFESAIEQAGIPASEALMPRTAASQLELFDSAVA